MIRNYIFLLILLSSQISSYQRSMPCNAGYNAPYRIRSCLDVFTNFQFLYYQGIEEGLDVGSDQTTNGNATTIHIKGMDFSFDPGFKIGIGKYLNHDDWQVYFQYMRFHQTTSTSFTGDNITPYWSFQDAVYTQAKAKWKLKLDTFDLKLAREFFIGQCLTFKTHVGLRGAYIRQQYKATYEDFDTLTTSDNKLSSFGIGPSMGFDMKWFVCNQFHLFGDFVWGILHTSYTTFSQKIHSQGQLGNTSEMGEFTSTLKNDNPNFLRPEVEATVGLAWGRPYCSSKYYLDLKVGYNFHVFWDQNIFYTPVGTTYYSSNTGSLYLHGLMLSFGLHY